mmetsp:Transcript_38689/g.95980  ORF Transcript_38689/g.95980 Transcript_38689/m.95980 type:complete len:222 (+) Transcript_38689:258-923(+)
MRAAVLARGGDPAHEVAAHRDGAAQRARHVRRHRARRALLRRVRHLRVRPRVRQSRAGGAGARHGGDAAKPGPKQQPRRRRRRERWRRGEQQRAVDEDRPRVGGEEAQEAGHEGHGQRGRGGGGRQPPGQHQPPRGAARLAGHCQPGQYVLHEHGAAGHGAGAHGGRVLPAGRAQPRHLRGGAPAPAERGGPRRAAPLHGRRPLPGVRARRSGGGRVLGLH